jgi:hypothetical protein
MSALRPGKFLRAQGGRWFGTTLGEGEADPNRPGCLALQGRPRPGACRPNLLRLTRWQLSTAGTSLGQSPGVDSRPWRIFGADYPSRVFHTLKHRSPDSTPPQCMVARIENREDLVYVVDGTGPRTATRSLQRGP